MKSLQVVLALAAVSAAQHVDYPWDTSEFLCEVWNGGATGPAVFLGQTQTTAVHNAPVYTEFYPWFYADVNFWCLANTELSTGGWPSILTDNAQGPISHSFYSDDFIVWEPWLVSGKACNYFVRCDWLTGLSATTWAGIKSVF